MDYYQSYDRAKGYNLNPSSSKNFMLGRTHSKEAIEKISAAAKGRKMTEANRLKLLAANKNVAKPLRKLQPKENKIVNSKYCRNLKFRYHILNAEGEYICVINLANFCREGRYSLNHLRGMLFKNKFYKGWIGFAEPLKPIELLPKIKLFYFLGLRNKNGLTEHKSNNSWCSY